MNRNWNIFIQENASEYIVWKMVAILSGHLCIKDLYKEVYDYIVCELCDISQYSCVILR